MKVLLFGLPISLHRRLKEESGGDWDAAVPDGHDFRATPLTSNDMGFLPSDLAELDKAVGNGFTHILIPANRDWRQVAKRFEFDCRIHIERLRDPLRDLTWSILRDALHVLVAKDEVWLDKFCPRDLRHALLLPPPVFATNQQTDSYWRHCDAYSIEQFAAAEKLLEDVERHHRRPDEQGGRSWLDARNPALSHRPRETRAFYSDRENKKSYRFCYEIPAGFHYDVTDDSEKSFKIKIGGGLQTLTHCNVTPWGVVRKG